MPGSTNSRHSDTRLPRPPRERQPGKARPATGASGVEDTQDINRDKKWVAKTGDTMTGALKIDGGAAGAVQLTVEGAASQSADLAQYTDSAAVVLAKVSSVGKLTSVDADTGFTDPNGHFQGAEGRLNGLLTELGYPLAETTRSWMHSCDVFGGYAWNQAPSFFSAGGMYGKSCADAADTTIGFKNHRIPLWYQAVGGGTIVYIDIYWMADTKPASDQNVRIRTEQDAGYNVGDALPATTIADWDLTISSVLSTTKIYKQTITLTTPTIVDGKLMTRTILRRRAASDAADTYAGTFWVVGIDFRSGVKSA